MALLFALLIAYTLSRLVLGNFVKMTNIVPGVTSRLNMVTGVPVNGTDNVQTLTGTATSGAFKLSFDGLVGLSTLNFNATAAQIQTYLRALPNVGSTGVTCTGGPLGTAGVVCTFSGPKGRRSLPLMTVVQSTLAGGNVTVANTTPGVTATARGMAKGATIVNDATGIHYTNTGTPDAPTWTVVGTQV